MLTIRWIDEHNAFVDTGTWPATLPMNVSGDWAAPRLTRWQQIVEYLKVLVR